MSSKEWCALIRKTFMLSNNLQTKVFLLAEKKIDEIHLDEQQLLDSGERGLRAADDDCLRTFDLLRGLPSLSWLRSGDKCWRESRRPLDALSGLKLSRLALRSFSSPSPTGPVGDKAGCDSLRFPSGGHDSSNAVACLCNLCSLGLSGLTLESLLFTRPHWVVESRRPDGGAVGLVAGGVTLLVTIVGGGSAWQPISELVVTKYGAESEAVELVDGRCSCRKFGSSTTVNESRRFFVAPTTFGGGGVIARVIVESLRPLRKLSPEPRREPFRVPSVEAPVSVFSLSRSLSPGLSFRGHILLKSDVCDSRLDRMLLMPESALDSLRLRCCVACDWLCELLSVFLPHGRLLAKSASVSRRFSGAFWRFEPPPLHSRRISVSWANELRRRRCDGGGDVLGGEAADIWAAESRRPPNRCLIVDSSNCSIGIQIKIKRNIFARCQQIFSNDAQAQEYTIHTLYTQTRAGEMEKK